MESRRSSAKLVEQLAEAILRERPEDERLDVATLSFARMEVISHEAGRQVAARLQKNFSKTQADAIELKNEFFACAVLRLCDFSGSQSHPETVRSIR